MSKAPLEELLPSSWKFFLADQFTQDYFQQLNDFLVTEWQTRVVYPPREELFRAFELVAPEEVKVVVLGQDPYHGPGQANGLAFSVAPGCPLPPSLKNIYKELQSDLALPPPENGDLTPWARQGVLLLNAVLSVRAHEANSHQRRGWEKFTTAVVNKLNDGRRPLVFVLWGNAAQKKLPFIDQTRHQVITAAHPSPLSARYWFGNKSFSRINAALCTLGYKPIQWS